MRAVFVHDHVFTVADDQAVLSGGTFPANIWSRYLAHFDSLTVVARRAAGRASGDLTVSSTPGVSFRFAPSVSGASAQLRSRGAARRAIEDAVSGADALIARLPSELGFLAVDVARRSGVPYAVELVGCALDSYSHHGSLAAKVYAPLAYFRMKRAVAGAPFAIYVTRRFLQTRYPNAGRQGSASNVFLSRLDPEVRERAIASVRETGPFVLGTIGSLAQRYKGVQTTMQAMEILGRKDIVYRVLGGGDLEPWRRMAAELGVADQVEFCGVLPAGEAVLSWIDELDVYLQPSLTEGLPRALIEAMSRAKPALGSAVGGIPELLEPGMTHKAGDAGELAALIARLVDDPQERRRQAGRNFDAAGAFSKEALDQRRDAFWREFSAYAAGHKGAR